MGCVSDGGTTVAVGWNGRANEGQRGDGKKQRKPCDPGIWLAECGKIFRDRFNTGRKKDLETPMVAIRYGKVLVGPG